MSEELASQPRIKISWLVGTLAAFGIFAVIGAYSKRMTNDFPGFDQQRAEARYATLAKVRDDATKTLTTVAWIDQDKGTVRIPIEEAMMKEVDTLKAKPAAAGAEIPGSRPAPAPAPAASAPTTNSTTGAAPAKPKP